MPTEAQRNVKYMTKRQLRNETLQLRVEVSTLKMRVTMSEAYAKTMERLLKGRDERIRRMTPQYRTSPYCAVHESIAARQQVKGKNGSYVWMEYCNYIVREECDVA